MEMLQAAIAAGEIDLADDRFQVPRLKAVPKDPAVDETRRCLFREIGSAQLPDVIVETDARTGFSTTLLGRSARGTDELEALYAGLLALGTEKTASDMARMVRSEEHTSELQSLMRTSYAVFCLKKKKHKNT